MEEDADDNADNDADDDDDDDDHDDDDDDDGHGEVRMRTRDSVDCNMVVRTWLSLLLLAMQLLHWISDASSIAED